MEALGFSKTERRSFHDTEYVLSVSGDNESLSIEVEHAQDGRRWRAKFAARFIEEITQRTGNAKAFDVFVRMLLSALAQESDSVYLDILTARDLEMLRRHANPQGPPATTSTASQSDKRYMILTYRAEFDKVHYPLPLAMDELSEEDRLRSMVGRLRSELSQAQGTISRLEQKASEQEVANWPAAAQPGQDSDRLGQLQRQNVDLGEALQRVQKEADQLRSELKLRSASSGHGSDEVQKLRSEVTRMKGENKTLKDDVRQQQLASKRGGENVKLELKSERMKADRLQAQVRKLEEEKRVLGNRLQAAQRGQSAASRGQSAERSRPSSRTPSAERARPPSRPVSGSRPSSRQPPPQTRGGRAPSVASSRERTPSPSSFLTGARGRQAPGPPPREPREPQPRSQAAMNRSGSPGARGEDRTFSPGATLSPYRRPSGPPQQRRTPSPGTRSRERTPSPGSRVSGPPAAGANSAANRASLTLRERAAATSGAGSGNGMQKPVSTRYGGAGSSRPTSASRGAGIRQANAATVASGLDAADGRSYTTPEPPGPAAPHQPGSLFGLAHNLGLSPGSLGGAPVASSLGTSSEEAEACDIDARLQALQSFLKQTKNIAA